MSAGVWSYLTHVCLPSLCKIIHKIKDSFNQKILNIDENPIQIDKQIDFNMKNLSKISMKLLNLPNFEF